MIQAAKGVLHGFSFTVYTIDYRLYNILILYIDYIIYNNTIVIDYMYNLDPIFCKSS